MPRPVGLLQPGDHLRALPGFHARVGHADGQQHRRVACAVAHVVQRVHRAQALEPVGVGDGAELVDVRRPVLAELGAQRVGHADIADHAGEQVGPLGQRHAHGDAAGRPALDRQRTLARPALTDQVLAAVDQVAPGVGLAELLAALPPTATVLATPAHMRHRQHATAFQERQVARAEVRVGRDLVRTVGLHQRRVAAVARQALLRHHRQRHPGAVTRSDGEAHRLVGRQVQRRRWRQRHALGAAGHRVVAEHAERQQPSGAVQPQAVFGWAGAHARDRTLPGQWHRRQRTAAGQLAHGVVTAVQVAHVQAVARQHDAFDHQRAFGHHHRGLAVRGLRQRRAQHLAVLGAAGRQQVQVGAVEGEVDHLVVERADRLPLRLAGHQIGQAGHVQRVLAPHATLHQQQHEVARLGRQHVGELVGRHLHRGVLATPHHDRVVFRVGVQAVQQRRPVLVVVDRAGLAQVGHAPVEEATAVGQPGRLRVLRATDALRQHARRGHLHHVCHRVLAARRRQAVDHPLAVGRRRPPVQRQVNTTVALHRRRVDQDAFGASHAGAHRELEVVGPGRPHLVEQLPAGRAHAISHRIAARQGADARLQHVPAGDRAQHLARMRVLALHEGLPVAVLGVLHPAVRVGDRLAEEGLGDRFDAGHRRATTGGCAGLGQSGRRHSCSGQRYGPQHGAA